MTQRFWLVAALVAMGAGWGITIPLSKIAVSGDYRHFGVIFWQLVIGVFALGSVLIARNGVFRWTKDRFVLCLVVALLGTVIPNLASYSAARHLPAGWMAVVLSLVPMFAFPIAIALGLDRFAWGRFAGLLLGLAGVTLLVLPSLSQATGPFIWVAVALIAAVMYGCEGNYVSKWGTQGLQPLQVLFGASLIGLVIVTPLSLLTGSWFWPQDWTGLPELAILVSSVIHAFVYTAYVWMVGRAGAVFAVQVSYLVTGFGVIWSMAILNETYGSSFWLALAVMLLGLFLVQPRPTEALVPQRGAGQTPPHH